MRTILIVRRASVYNFYWKTNTTLSGMILGLYIFNMQFICFYVNLPNYNVLSCGELYNAE